MSDSADSISRLIGVEINPKSASMPVGTLLTDSRSLGNPQDTLFFALRTSRADGHRYVKELYDKGVRMFVVDTQFDAVGMEDALFFKVDDPLVALRRIASKHRENSREVLAITGSKGKTSLKEWLNILLCDRLAISRSPRSFNSQIGVPLSVWGIRKNTDLAIIEAGISGPGEMEALRQCIDPDTVIITNIGEEHAEGFINHSQQVAEKFSLAGSRTKLLIYPADDPTLSESLKRLPSGCIPVGWSLNSDVEAQLKARSRRSAGVTTIEYEWVPSIEIEGGSPACIGSFRLLTSGVGDEENAVAALTWLLATGRGSEAMETRSELLRHVTSRVDVSEGVNGCSLLFDSYPSDPDSLRPAIDFMHRRRNGLNKMTLILSDLPEGIKADRMLIEQVARQVAEAGIDRFIGIGPHLQANADLFGDNARFFSSTEEMLAKLSPSDFQSEIILLKGSPGFRFHKIREMLELRTHETVLEVNLSSIVANYNYFRSKVAPATGIIAMVKASGYGAGSREIAKTLQDCGAAYLAVAVLDEGIDLRQRGITMPIMVMNPKVVNYRQMFAHHLEPEIYSLEMLRDVVRESEKCGVKDYPIHLKLDTGMHRMGLIESELPQAMDIIASQSGIKVSTVFSHLATADCLDMDSYTRYQLKLFADYTAYMSTRLPYGFKRHILNSAGILRFPEADYDFVRLGIGLYGVETLPPEVEAPLAPVSSLYAPIIAIRDWKKGESVGYGRKTILKRDSRIATIPIGYADGINRRFGNGGLQVLVAGKYAPTAGNICMDACMIDVTGIDCRVGDRVEIFGENAPVERMAQLLDTIPYEILTSISPRVKRIYYRE